MKKIENNSMSTKMYNMFVILLEKKFVMIFHDSTKSSQINYLIHLFQCCVLFFFFCHFQFTSRQSAATRKIKKKTHKKEKHFPYLK